MNFRTAASLTASACLGMVAGFAGWVAMMAVVAMLRGSAGDGLAFGAVVICLPIAVLAGWAACRLWPTNWLGL